MPCLCGLISFAARYFEGEDMIRAYLKDNILITDGAMGTYYAEITGKHDVPPETANLDDAKTIERIHHEYIEAGAKLIKTNTFSANSIGMDASRADIEKIISAGIAIANRVVLKKNVFVAASIGPIPDMVGKTDMDPAVIIDEYRFVVDVFLKKNVKIFIFETFSDIRYLKEITQYIKEKDNSIFILTQFATTPEGFTRKALSIDRIITMARSCDHIDAYGFNCGVGPTHIFNNLKGKILAEDLVAVAPNAGYPEIVRGRTVYINNPDYFAERMREIRGLGAKILGGCCGTTPAHIKKMAERTHSGKADSFSWPSVLPKPSVLADRKNRNAFSEKLKRDQFVLAVELDPPFNADPHTIMNNARICKESGVDIVTIADSPMGRARVDSMMLAAKIKREAGIDVIPHICCRDKNINALKSALLAGYIENIRNVLAVTGDPIAESDKSEIKSVFNLNSLKLIELVSSMNKDVFSEEPIHIGGALNLNGMKPEGEIQRMLKKADRGATFFLTQPIFDDQVINFLPQINSNDHVKILGGIMPLVSYRNAQFLNNEVAGIRIPESIINKFDPAMEKEEAEKLGIEIALEIAEKMKNAVHGFYFITPFNRVSMITKIINRLGM
ncbi:bifunctional homocysteine S-methyltransferase/methylenetetrahydrofolate reductase [Desulfotomaculum sp. 1211_IL3151]|uniref:bifunctional homocysteine S-methyltransferase/methylenetetrahydrofolate reductase n=1 Tax=Desulfotomaculum sp. 1211_IL3151 TaxID=3084055 RepID=UPI002FD88FBF